MGPYGPGAGGGTYIGGALGVCGGVGGGVARSSLNWLFSLASDIGLASDFAYADPGLEYGIALASDLACVLFGLASDFAYADPGLDAGMGLASDFAYADPGLESAFSLCSDFGLVSDFGLDLSGELRPAPTT